MKTLNALILFLSCFLLVSSQGSLYAQKKVGSLTFDIVRPTAGNGQEIVYKDKNKQEVKVEYGTLVVPERHDKPNGNTIELAFFRLKSVSPNPGSPIVFLEGGPGLPGTNAYYGPMMELLIPLREDRSQVDSSVPTLLISGTLDGFTPVSNAEEVAKGLPNSVHVIVDGGGHEDLLVGTQKAKEVILEFMKGAPVSTKSIGFPPIKFKTIKGQG